MAVGVLVTGGAGVFGRCVVKRLRGRLDRVISSGRTDTDGTDVVWDIETQDAPSGSSGVDTVIHAAARIGSLGEPIQDGLPFFETNVNGTLRVARWCATNDIHKLVFVSSAIVYGTWEARPKSEQDEPKPWIAGAYAQSKWQAEQALNLLSDTGCDWVILRLASLYGAGYEEGLIANMLRRGEETGVIRLRPPIDDSFDLLHVSDAAAAVEHALVTDATGIWNIGGRLTTILEIAETCAQCTGAEIIVDEDAGQRPPRIINWVDDQRARGVLGHQNLVSLEQGIAEMADRTNLRSETMSAAENESPLR